jgi:titin
LELLEGRLLPAMTFPVTSTGDSGTGTLRQAILDANANPGPDKITFNIAGTAPYLIQPTSALPFISDPIVIDGTTQPGFAGKPLIQLDGSKAGGANGLTINAGSCTIKGLDVTHFNGDGIKVQASNNSIQSNYIGTDPTGTKPQSNTQNGVEIDAGTQNVIQGNLVSGNGTFPGHYNGIQISGIGTNQNVVVGNRVGTDFSGNFPLPNACYGVAITSSAQNNQIGASGKSSAEDLADRNIISGNGCSGVEFQDNGTNHNIVAGNFIGTNAAGSKSLANAMQGVLVRAGAQSNQIGTNGTDIDLVGERNVISGNAGPGVDVSDPGTNSNIVAGNYIGTDVTGSRPLSPVNGAGVVIVNGAQANRIGTDGNGVGDTAEGNVISANSREGIYIANPGTSGNIVAGNYIGTDKTGSFPLGNAFNGIHIANGATGNRIGTDGKSAVNAGERNVISGNRGDGIDISDSGTTGNIVAGNYIGTNGSGAAPLANFGLGVSIFAGAQANVIGADGKTAGGDAAERNVISGNNSTGINIGNPGTTGNIVAGNYIGVSADGTAALPNADAGVAIYNGAQRNRIGTDGKSADNAGERNVISGDLQGVWITDGSTTNNVVAGNYIGTNATGAAALGNTQYGVIIRNGAQGNRIGTDGIGAGAAAERNVISGNHSWGVFVTDTNTTGNIVAGNYIGTNAAGNAALGNWLSGVLIYGGAQSNRVGTDATGLAVERNFISGNVMDGIAIQSAQHNAIAGNRIGLGIGVALPNGRNGVDIQGGAQFNTIGASTATANVIDYNHGAGVAVRDNGTNGNSIRMNQIAANVGLGIDLNDDGVTANAPGVRGGPNDTQNYPVLTKAVSTTASTSVTGTFNSLPSQAFTIDFHASSAADPSGYGQGQHYLGSKSVNTDTSGNASISASLPGGLAGQVISATATAANGDTSEFSQDVTATSMAARDVVFILAGANAAGAPGTWVQPDSTDPEPLHETRPNASSSLEQSAVTTLRARSSSASLPGVLHRAARSEDDVLLGGE